jgi:hypothetical protein
VRHPLLDRRLQRLAASLLVTAVVTAAAPLVGQSGGKGTIYAGTYAGSVYVIDEKSFEVRNKIPLDFRVPLFDMQISSDRSHLYISSANTEQWAVIDLESEEVVDYISLQDGNEHVLIWTLAVDPSESYALMVVRSTTLHRDRYEIGEYRLVQYDLESHEVTREIAWPDDKTRELTQILFSPAGDHVYLLADDLIVLDTESWEEVDRWQLSRALHSGLGSFRFGFPRSFHEEPGFYTGLFHVEDPVQNRRFMGIARVDLAARDVDFSMLGPSEGTSFTLAPGRKKAYGLRSEIGDYEFWTFDLESNRVASKVGFEGRPRMSMSTSSNGKLIYIYGAGNTFDIYDAATFRHLRTEELDADMIGVVLVPPPAAR